MQFNWVKLGQVFNVDEIEKTWFMESYAQAPSVLVRDSVVRVYFSTRPTPDANGQYVSYSTYLELDRNDLTRVKTVAKQPVLELGALGTFDEFGIYPISVIDHGALTLAYYGGWTRCCSVPFNVAIGLAVSNDGGRTFERVGNGPVLGYAPGEPFVISGPKIRRFNDRFYLFYIAGKEWIVHNGRPEPIYRIRLASSLDGLHWSRYNRDLIEPVLGEYEAQASPDVICLDGLYHMFFSYRHGTDYRSGPRGYRIGYATSSDLETWTRNDFASDLEPSQDGWDSESVSYPHVFQLDGTVYMLYLGNNVGRSGFGLARLER